MLLYYGLLRHLPDGYDSPAFKIFNALRSWACRPLFASAGSHLSIHQGARFGTGRNIRVGSHTNIGVNCYINGRGGVTLGDNVLMGPDVMIFTGTHTYADLETPIQKQPMRYAEVKIGNDVWLGARVVILPGVEIGDGCVIGANSVVTRNIPSYSVAVGAPAQVSKSRRGPLV